MLSCVEFEHALGGIAFVTTITVCINCESSGPDQRLFSN